jgi:hypothetical protein
MKFERSEDIFFHLQHQQWFVCLLFYVQLKNFSLILGRHLQNVGICSAFRAFQQGGIFIVPHLL